MPDKNAGYNLITLAAALVLAVLTRGFVQLFADTGVDIVFVFVAPCLPLGMCPFQLARWTGGNRPHRARCQSRELRFVLRASTAPYRQCSHFTLHVITDRSSLSRSLPERPLGAVLLLFLKPSNLQGVARSSVPLHMVAGPEGRASRRILRQLASGDNSWLIKSIP